MNKTQNILLLCFLLATISNQQVCAHSQYFNGQRCAPCQANCQCSEQNTCSSCLSGYTYDSTFKNCLQCPIATNAVNVGCSDCCFQIVSTAFVCSTCPSLSNTYLLGGQCIRLLGCNSINSNGLCQNCGTGYFLQDGKCIVCHASCSSCTDSTFCTSCTTGYYNATNANYGTCAPCSTGCSTCSSSTTCSACLQRYRLFGSTCVGCGANCLHCTNSACTNCASGYALVGGVCYTCSTAAYGGTAGCLACSAQAGVIKCSNCSPGFYLSSSDTCIACATAFPYSLYCTNSRPLQCLNDFSPVLANRYYLVNNRCIPNTNKCKLMSNEQGYCSSCYFQVGAYYKLVNGLCVQCNQVGCASYSSTCQCLACQSGYQFVNRQCVACQNLNCYTCQNEIRSCQVCAPHYGLISSACIACTQGTCLNCDGDASKCINCLTGYYNYAGNCYRCQANCISCTSSTLCTSCDNGYYLLGSGRCKSLPTNCVTVNTSGACTKCAYGYQTVKNICVPCSSDLLNLGGCQRFCPSYYALLKYQMKMHISVVFAILLALGLGLWN